jgi:hypothetical protein
MTLGLGGCELLAVGLFGCNGFVFRLSLAEAFRYVMSALVKCLRKENIHVFPLHMGPQRLFGDARATWYLHRLVCAVSKYFEPS